MSHFSQIEHIGKLQNSGFNFLNIILFLLLKEILLYTITIYYLLYYNYYYLLYYFTIYYNYICYFIWKVKVSNFLNVLNLKQNCITHLYQIK